MKNKFLAFFLVVFFVACQSGQNSTAQSPSDVHKVLVKEVLQTNEYTYLLVTENGGENWLALPKMLAASGETYYYRNGFKMTNFESKELGKKFETIYFLESVSTTPDFASTEASANPHTAVPATIDTATQYKAQVIVEKEDVSVKPADNGITVAFLFANKAKYEGKTVRVKGKVTKFNTKIMKHNWIHLQDGTEYEGKFDLTATSDIEVAVGETITLEGKIALNKDFGYGYSYEILLEDSRLIK